MAKAKMSSGGSFVSTWGFWILAMIVLVVIAYAVYSMTSKSHEGFLDAEDSEFLNTCDDTKKPFTLIFFSMATCPHCRDFEPVWNQFESYAQSNEVLSNKMCVTRVSAENREMCRKFNVQGFPTIMLVDNRTRKTTEFKSARTLESLKSFVLQNTA